MLPWHVPYFGWTRLPFDVSEFEITHFFSLQPEEGSAVLTRYRESLHLGAALQIGFLKMCGRPARGTFYRNLERPLYGNQFGGFTDRLWPGDDQCGPLIGELVLSTRCRWW